MKPFFYSFCFFLAFCLQLFGSSFGDLDDAVRDLVFAQHQSHKQVIDNLRGGLLKLQADFSAMHGSGAGGAASSSHKSGTKSSKSVMQKWQEANFAVGSLIVYKVGGSHEVIPVQGVGIRQSDDAPTIYDSCADRTCNMLPDAGLCVSQWHRYLGDAAKILNSGTEAVRGRLMGDAGDSPLNGIQVSVSEIQRKIEEEEPLSLDDFKDINDHISIYQSLLSNTWVPVGWHSEQRLIYDLDEDNLKNQLRDIHGITPIQCIIGCVYTHFSPCCDDKGCFCMRSLSNWPECWTFLSELPGIPTSMTVSYSFQHPSLPVSLDPYRTGKFFIQNLGEGPPSESLELAKEYLKAGKLNRQIRRTFNHYEKRLITLLRPLRQLAQSKWPDLKISYHNNESNLHDVRDFRVKFPGGGRLVKSVDEAGKRVLKFISPGPVTASSPITELSVEDVTVPLNPEDSDWNIWLSSVFLCLSSAM